MQQLRGMENLLMDLAYRSKEIYRLRDDLLEFNLEWINRWLSCAYDGLHFADDWGDQKTLLINPQLWRDFFKPVYKAMFTKVRMAGVDVHFHSDGIILDIIPDLINLGVNVLNCQATLIGLGVLKRTFAAIFVSARISIDREYYLLPSRVRLRSTYGRSSLIWELQEAELSPMVRSHRIRRWKTYGQCIALLWVSSFEWKVKKEFGGRLSSAAPTAVPCSTCGFSAPLNTMVRGLRNYMNDIRRISLMLFSRRKCGANWDKWVSLSMSGASSGAKLIPTTSVNPCKVPWMLWKI
jgi:hypothetical protein